MDHDQCDQIWQNFATMAKFYKSLAVYFLFSKIVNQLWQIWYISGLIFIVPSGQILKFNLTIWSHCPAQTTIEILSIQIIPKLYRNKRRRGRLLSLIKTPEEWILLLLHFQFNLNKSCRKREREGGREREREREPELRICQAARCKFQTEFQPTLWPLSSSTQYSHPN